MKTVTDRDFKRDDRGFSLVELIVAMLIMSVIVLMVVLMISTSRRTYNTVKTDAVLQSEAEIVRNFIGEIAVEAKSWGQKEYIDGTDSYRFIWLKAPDNDKTGVDRNYFYYIFLLKGDKLRYGKFPESAALNNVTDSKIFGTGFTFPDADSYGFNILTDPYTLLAEHLSEETDEADRGISCNESPYLDTDNKYKTAKLVNIKLNFLYNEHKYGTTMNYAARNNDAGAVTTEP